LNKKRTSWITGGALFDLGRVLGFTSHNNLNRRIIR
jgi:hypothetical protein